MARRGMHRAMRSFIIHMRGDTKRAPNVEKLLKTLPDAQVIDAVVGKDILAQQSFATRPGDLHQPEYPFPLSPGEVGCFLSHRKCWQRILDEDLSHALIVEDDLSLDPELWAEAMDLVETHSTPETFIRLPAKRREVAKSIVAESDRAKMFLPKVIGLQTVCQVVGRSAAKNLLDATEVLDRPVDTFLQMHWVTGQPVHTILPNGVSEITEDLGGSTIQKKNTGDSKLQREFKRAVYRARVSLRPQPA